MRLTTGFLLAMLLGGCASSQPATTTTQPVGALPDAAQCAAKGGEIRPVCRRGMPTCVIAYADAGHACSDSSECQGRCLVNRQDGSAAPDSGKAVGVCEADNDRCGCSAEIIGGVARPTLCVD